MWREVSAALGRFWHRLKRTVVRTPANETPDSPARATGPEEWDAQSGVAPADYDPDDLNNQIDVVTELGVEPDVFLLDILDEQGGRLPQQAFTDFTDWSESVLSRVLRSMEEDGQVVRVQVGREKVVCLPEHVPGRAPSVSEDSDDPSAA